MRPTGCWIWDFHEDIMKIIQYLPKKRQNLMFAATMPNDIRILAKKVLNNPVEMSIAVSKPAEKILQVAYVVYETQKLPLAIHLLKGRNLKSVIVFCSTKLAAKQLGRQLKREGLKAEDIHSDLDQKEREEIMLQFRNRKLNILVATDLLSRGIDIDNIELIINYDVPHEGEDYIHRIGRTARAESDGIAITLISEEEQYKFARIEKLLEKKVTKSMVPEEFGETPDYDPNKNKGRGGGRNFRGKSQGGRKPQGKRSEGGRSEGKTGTKGEPTDPGGTARGEVLTHKLNIAFSFPGRDQCPSASWHESAFDPNPPRSAGEVRPYLPVFQNRVGKSYPFQGKPHRRPREIQEKCGSNPPRAESP